MRKLVFRRPTTTNQVWVPLRRRHRCPDAHFDSIDVSDGTIYITYGGDANERIQGTTLSIRPLVSESGDVLWLCGNANPPQNAYYNSAGAAGDGTDSGQGMTDLEDKWLPAACRTGFGSA